MKDDILCSANSVTKLSRPPGTETMYTKLYEMLPILNNPLTVEKVNYKETRKEAHTDKIARVRMFTTILVYSIL